MHKLLLTLGICLSFSIGAAAVVQYTLTQDDVDWIVSEIQEVIKQPVSTGATYDQVESIVKSMVEVTPSCSVVIEQYGDGWIYGVITNFPARFRRDNSYVGSSSSLTVTAYGISWYTSASEGLPNFDAYVLFDGPGYTRGAKIPCIN